MFVCDDYQPAPNSSDYVSYDCFTQSSTTTSAQVFPPFRNLHTVIEIDQQRKIVAPNHDELRTKIERIDGLGVRDGRLIIRDQNAMRHVRRFLESAEIGEGYRQPVRCSNRKWPLLLELEAHRESFSVRIVDVGAPIALDQTALKQGFGLTSAENRIAELIANGAKPVEIAELSGVAVSTVRTHIKSLFSKTRASNQLELALLLSHFRDIE